MAQQGWLDLRARKTQQQSDSVQPALQAISTAPQGSRLLPRALRDPCQGRNHGGLCGPHACPCLSDAWTVKEGTAAPAPSSSSGERHHCFSPWRSSPKLNHERCSPVARRDHTAAARLCTVRAVSCGQGWACGHRLTPKGGSPPCPAPSVRPLHPQERRRLS